MEEVKREREYIAIDLKSFYASVECVDRGLDPLTTNLVVADASRTEKTICLAVSPSLKAHGIPGRPRLFEVVSAVKEINSLRRAKAPKKEFRDRSVSAIELDSDPSLELDYVCAVPRMALYMAYSTRIYKIYLKYIAPEDIHVYSCDEVFMDVTDYLNTYRMDSHELALKIVRDVLGQTGITATAGIGTNLYLAKIAMDIKAKKMPADADGVRIARLDEMGYRREMWDHTPLKDFWRVGPGTVRRLARLGLHTMGDIAAYSESCEDNLYRMFGVNAELLIDHAWGWEPCRISDIKSFKPMSNSVSTGQVLTRPYSVEEGSIIVREMTDILCLDLAKKGLVTDQIVLNVGYEAVGGTEETGAFDGEIAIDRYGRVVPKPAHGTVNLGEYTTQTSVIAKAVLWLYDRIMDHELSIRRISIAACNVISEDDVPGKDEYEQMDLFTDYSEKEKQEKEYSLKKKKEKALQLAELDIKQRFGKNAILKGTDLLEGATTIERNRQIGGHRA